MRDHRLRSRFLSALTAMAVLAVGGAAFSDGHGLERTPAPKGVSLYILSPHAGETVSGPVTVRFGLSGMGVAPAGVQNPKTGHHHLVLDAPLPDMGKPIPNDANYRHFGGGQTQVTLDLAPGEHTLQLVLGDHLHIPFDPPIVSDPITIQVK